MKLRHCLALLVVLTISLVPVRSGAAVGQVCALMCPSNITVSNDPNQCGAVVPFDAPTTTGTCGPVSCSPPSGSFFPVGTTTVTCTEQLNGAGPTPPASCTFSVTVIDTQPPSITCPNPVTASGTTVVGCTFTSTVTFMAPAASDNCPGVTTLCTPASGTTFPEGTTTVTCTATDMSGNTATCSFTVAVSGLGVFGACATDDASGDTFSIVTDPANPNVGFWRYRVVMTGEIFCGTASQLAFYPNRSLTASDRDDPRFFMNANLNFGANAGTVRVIDFATGREFVLRDRNLRNSAPCL